MRDTRNSHSISVEEESVTQKMMHGLVLPFTTPQSCELAISRTKRGGVEFIMASCILLASLVWLVPLLSEYQFWLPHTPSPSTLNFFTLDPIGMLQIMSEGWHKASCSSNSEESQLSFAGLAVDNLHFVAFPQSYSSLESVRVHLAYLAYMTIWRGVPLQEQREKVSFSGGLMCIPSVCSSWGTIGLLQQLGVPLHTVPPPTSPALYSSPSRCQL